MNFSLYPYNMYILYAAVAAVAVVLILTAGSALKNLKSLNALPLSETKRNLDQIDMKSAAASNVLRKAFNGLKTTVMVLIALHVIRNQFAKMDERNLDNIRNATKEIFNEAASAQKVFDTFKKI